MGKSNNIGASTLEEVCEIVTKGIMNSPDLSPEEKQSHISQLIKILISGI